MIALLKKDVDYFRRQLKLDHDLLTIHEVLNVYVVKGEKSSYFYDRTSFSLLARDEQKMYMENFRKTLMGQIDQKLFPLRFKDRDDLESQGILYKCLSATSDEWVEAMVQFVHGKIEEEPFQNDMVYTFARGEIVAQEQGPMSEEELEDAYVHPFILCTLNETKNPESELLFDYVEREFMYHVEVNPIINLQAPNSGFLFPTFREGLPNVNELLYTTRKAYVLDYFFLEHVLQVEERATAEDEKLVFTEVLKQVASDQLDTKKLSTIYEGVHERILEYEELEEDEEATIDYRDVGELLVRSGIQGVENEEIKEAFQSVAADPLYEVRAENAVPKFTTKSVKIKTKVANFSLRPKDLPYVRKVKVNGKLCLIIEVDEESEIDGFSLIPETSLIEEEE